MPGKPPSKTGLALRGASWFGLGTVFEYLLTFLTMVWLARLIKPAEFGVASLAISFLSFARLFSEMAMGPALIRREIVDEAHIDVAFICVLTLACFASACTVLAAPAVAGFFGAPELRSICWAIAVLIPVHGAISIANALLSRRSAFKFMALATLPGLILGYAATSIFLAARGFGAWSIMLGSIVQYTMTGAIMCVRAGYVPSLAWSAAAFKDLFSFSFWQSISQVVNQAALSGDNFVVGRTLGMGPLGLYGRAYKLMEIPVNIVSTTLFKVSFPLMSSIQARRERLAAVYLTSLGGLLTALIPFSVFLLFAGRPLVLLLLGPNWEGAIAPFQILCISLTFRSAYRHVNLPAVIIGGASRVTILTVFYAVWVVGGALIAVAWAGNIVAVAIAVSIAIFAHYLTSAWFANRLLNIPPGAFAKLHLPGLSIGCAVGVLLFLAREAPGYDHDHAMALAIDVVVSGTAALICPYLWPRAFLGTRNLELLSRLSQYVPVGRGAFQTWLAHAVGSGAKQQ